MALTDQEKHDTIYYLGYPGKTLVPDSTSFNNTVSDRLENLTEPIENIIKDILSELSSIHTQMNKARTRATTKKVDGITLNERELSQLKAERNFWIRRLSDEIDLPIVKKGGSMVGVVS